MHREQDWTFCDSDCTNIDCHRNKTNIDWKAPNHVYIGVSLSDFHEICDNCTPPNAGGCNKNSLE